MRDAAPARVNDDLLDAHARWGKPVLRLYEPAHPTIVLGASGRPEVDLYLGRVTRDDVHVQSRRGGGGAVVLSPGQLVIALVTQVEGTYQNRAHLRLINGWIAAGLAGAGWRGIEACGICDLAIDGRKILGASLFRRRNILFYQSSLLVDCDVTLFARYLRHPGHEPDYRRGRPHTAFCTTLASAGRPARPATIAAILTPLITTGLERGLAVGDP